MTKKPDQAYVVGDGYNGNALLLPSLSPRLLLLLTPTLLGSYPTPPRYTSGPSTPGALNAGHQDYYAPQQPEMRQTCGGGYYQQQPKPVPVVPLHVVVETQERRRKKDGGGCCAW